MLRDVARQQVVDADHGVAAIEQGFGEVRADEAGGAGDDHSLFHGTSPSRPTLGPDAGARRPAVQYACFWKKPFSTVSHMIFTSSDTDQFSM